jgi:hypothetical protein
MIVHLCLQASEHEASSQMLGTGPQWARDLMRTWPNFTPS